MIDDFYYFCKKKRQISKIKGIRYIYGINDYYQVFANRLIDKNNLTIILLNKRK